MILEKKLSSITSLRCIAICGVIIFHYFNQYNDHVLFLSGGFTGVDIFLVIAGFLAAKSISNNSNYLEYLKRRIRRIFPIFLASIIVIFIILTFAYYGGQLEDNYYNLLFSSIFISNITNIGQSNYFNPLNSNIFLNFWSLSIEMQFYIISPFIIKNLNDRYRIAFLLSSFILCIIFYNFQDTATFYLPVTRIWEYMIGIEVYLRQKKFCHRSKFICYLGLALCISGFFIITEKSEILFLEIAFFSIIGTILVLLYSPAIILNSNRIILFIGGISYPLYLIHWPIYSLVKSLNNNILSIYNILFVLIISVFYSYLCTRYIEKNNKNRNILFLLFIYTILITSIYSCILYKFSLKSYFYNTMEIEKTIAFSPLSEKCHDKLSLFDGKLNTCKIGNKNKGASLLIFGDSHAASQIDTIEKALLAAGISSEYASSSACPSMLFLDSKYYRKECIKRNKEIFNYLETDRIKEVILISRWEDYYNNNYIYSLHETLNYLIKKNINIFFVLDNPYQNILPFSHLEQKNDNVKNLKIEDYDKQTAKQLTFLRSYINNPQIHVIDFTNDYCQNGECPLVRDMKYLYYDKGHLSYHGSMLTYDSWLRIFNQINQR